MTDETYYALREAVRRALAEEGYIGSVRQIVEDVINEEMRAGLEARSV